jgi:predicted phosphate transport protein (TIGR00153 family)
MGIFGGNILQIFAESPFKQLQSHMDLITDCVKQLKPVFDRLIQRDFPALLEAQKALNLREQEADQIQKKIRLTLPKSIFTPVSRWEFVQLLSEQDRIASCAKRIAQVVNLRKLLFPKLILGHYLKLLNLSIESVTQVRTIVFELDELIENGFQGREVQSVQQMIEKLDRLDGETEQLEQNIYHELFEYETSDTCQHSEIDLIFLYKILDWTAELNNRAQSVGHRFENFLVR